MCFQLNDFMIIYRRVQQRQGLKIQKAQISRKKRKINKQESYGIDRKMHHDRDLQ